MQYKINASDILYLMLVVVRVKWKNGVKQELRPAQKLRHPQRNIFCSFHQDNRRLSVRTIVYKLLRNFTALTVKLSISTKSKFLHFWTRLFIWNLNPFQTVFAIMQPWNEDQSTPRQIIRGCVFMLVIRWYLMSVCVCAWVIERDLEKVWERERQWVRSGERGECVSVSVCVWGRDRKKKEDACAGEVRKRKEYVR